MHPQIQQDKPGHCPICGMTLVPVRKGDAPQPATSTAVSAPTVPSSNGEHVGVYVPPDHVALAGVRTAVVAKQDVTVEIRTNGQVANNSDLAVSQKEYLIARPLGDKSLIESSRRKLQLFGMSDSWIKDLEKRGQPDVELYQSTGTKRVIIEAAVYESDLSSVIMGQQAVVQFTHQGGQEYTGTVIGLNPRLNSTTRAATVFIEIPQRIENLRAGMVVSVRLKDHLGERLVVPESAVIDTGTRKVVVTVQDNYYDPREVETGEHAKDMIVIKSGVQEGETVVVAANFLLDSEAQLKARLSTMTGHHH